ncbi:MAG: ankyrin repeat domain-containing protein [Stenotrophomonas sp.]
MSMGRRSVRRWVIMSMLMGMVTPVSAASLDERLHRAAEKGDASAVRTLLGHGAQVDARGAGKVTPLLSATHHNHVEAALALIQAGADVNAKDAIQDSPYLYAGARGHIEILRATLAAGADLKSTNRYGGTALIPAAERGHVEAVATLIAAGVHVDHVNTLKWTALLEAIILADGGARHVEIVRQLIAAGADVNLPDGEGVSPLQHARQRGYREMEVLLLAAGARSG